MSWVQEALDKHGIDNRLSGSELLLNCPFCSDHKFHMYLNPDKRVFICFRCNERGRLLVLFKKLGIGMEPTVRRRPVAKPLPVLPSLPPTTPLLPGTRAWNYLTDKRNMSQQDIRDWQVSQASGKFVDYICWPMLDQEGQLHGAHLRRWTLSGPKAIMYPTGIGRYLLGPHLQNQNHRLVVVTEGPYDAVHVTRELREDGCLGVALMGHNITKIQCAQLRAMKLPVAILLDSDVKKEAAEMAGEVRRWAPVRGVGLLEKGDPDENSSFVLRKVLGLT